MKAQYTKDGEYRIVQRANGTYRLQKRTGQEPNNSGEHGYADIGPKLDKADAESALRQRQPKMGA